VEAEVKAAFFFCLLLAAPRAEAFLFGGAPEKKAAERLAAMRVAYGDGDCAAVRAQAEPFLSEKPPRALREEADVYLGACYERDGLSDKAVSHYRIALELFPENAVFALRLGALYNSAGFYAAAAPLFARVSGKDPSDAAAAAGLARAYYGLGFLSRAREYYSKAAELKKYSDLNLLREYAGCLLKQRDWAGADALIAKGAAAEPAAAYWPAASARALAGRGRYAEAAAALEAAEQLEPAAQRRLERSLYLAQDGRHSEALAAAEAELARGGGALASFVKAFALYNSGRADEAAPFFTAAAAAGDAFTSRLAGAFLEAMKKEGGPCRR